MAEDGEARYRRTSPYHHQETFQRAQETQAEHEFPQSGIVRLPPGSRGPRSLYLKRHANSFGFTLRHFIVYPPDSIAEDDGRHAAVGALLAPMDTIFVKSVAEGSPAKVAGLHRGDRIISVNRVPVAGKSYAQVVQLIQRSPDYLHLLVVPKEEDVLQQHFSETAYNPLSNQQPLPEYTDDQRFELFRFLTQNRHQPRPPSFQVDAASWRSLQNPYESASRRRYSYEHNQENIYSTPQEAYAELTHDSVKRARAQPQVPLYKKMGRRASEGSTLSDNDYSEYGLTDMVVGSPKMKSASKTAYAPEGATQTLPPNVGRVGAGEVELRGRRASSSSLTSSLADGSKDSLSSFDSASTLTGQETDDSVIMSRFRKSFQQKEEFLRRSSTSTEPTAIQQREFYGRPKKLERAMWPPTDVPLQDSPSKNAKPMNQNIQRVREMEGERDLVNGNPVQQFLMGAVCSNAPLLKGKVAKDWSSCPVQEAATAPASLDHVEKMNGSASGLEDGKSEDQRQYPPGLQIVSKRARDFESGKALPEDDPILSDRMKYYRSELAKLSSKRLEPNVQDRTRDYETLTSELRKEGAATVVPAGSATLNRMHRDSRSLDSQGSNTSGGSLGDRTRLSGNVVISSGSKYIHCPPPSEYKDPADIPLDNRPVRHRERSNSADSWATALQDSSDETPKSKEVEPTSPSSPDLPPLIPVPVERMQVAPAVSITPAAQPAVRPTQLDLGPVRPARHLKLPEDRVSQRSLSPVGRDDNNKPVVVRRTKNTNIADDERAMRRESYLKATEGGRVHFDSDLSDGDISPHILRSAHRRWRPPMFPGDIQQLRKLFEDAASSLGGSASGGSSSSVSLEREKGAASPAPPAERPKNTVLHKEGLLHCKITEIDGKRAADRSWKMVWAVVVGPKLYLCKDHRHHQSPVDTSEPSEPALASGVDMRASVVRVAEDYTKRKHVLRVSSVQPCRSEFLLQAENTVDLADWVKVLQEQVAATTEIESKLDSTTATKQQAVPQTTPGQTTIQVQGSSRLSPPTKSKSSTTRNRSPTGQSPVSKTRKPSTGHVTEVCTSPKSKTWRGRVAKQFRRIHQGANSPSSPTAPEGSTFGVPIEQCIPSEGNSYVPKFVEICTRIVDERGLNVVGIYRVPGNNASVTALTEEVNRNYETVPQEDPRWNDVHVVSSLLKSFFRKMPDSLVTNQLYPSFIEADKIEDARMRMIELKRLIHCLPPHNYHTLKHVILHLRNVVDHCEVNKMEAKNLAIVFGPTIVRVEEESMQTMVNNMNHQCKIVESLLSAEWFFCDENLNPPLPIVPECANEDPTDSSTNQALLLDNICKYEALKDQKEKNRALFSSIKMAAQRKVKKKTAKSGHTTDSKDDGVTANGLKEFTYQLFSPADLKQSSTTDGKTNNIPTTVSDIEKPSKTVEKVPWFNYSTDKEDFHRRVENFELETKAMLTMPRKSEISVNSLGPLSTSSLNSSTTSVQNTRLFPGKPLHEPYALTKTHSASNVFSRTLPLTTNNTRNSLDVIDGPYSARYRTANIYGDSARFNGNSVCDANRNESEALRKSVMTAAADRNLNVAAVEGQFLGRRGSSAENVNCGFADLNANGGLKKVKYENELDVINQRTSSLDSLSKLQANIDDGPDLVTTMTKLYDEKLKNENPTASLLLQTTDIPFADESPSKTAQPPSKHPNKENVPQPDLYRNPSLHKNKSTTFQDLKKLKEVVKNKSADEEKDRDSTVSDGIPDNERHIRTYTKLKRSESLNKPERTNSPVSSKLKRSESLKRSDSLTKTEKTESNINRRRELITKQRSKRKNGMPDRSIKRRHTVGGTKDPDKVNLLDKKDCEEETHGKENKDVRTSSPDLSSARRDRLLLEISFVGPESMVVALRQHLVGARPQSFPEAGVFKVPLESHV